MMHAIHWIHMVHAVQLQKFKMFQRISIDDSDRFYFFRREGGGIVDACGIISKNK